MTKERLLETLFNEWSEQHKDSHEYGTACATGDIEDIIHGVIAESKNAYIAGFYAAVALLTGGVN
jgi:hypothetical protein